MNNPKFRSTFSLRGVLTIFGFLGAVVVGCLYMMRNREPADGLVAQQPPGHDPAAYSPLPGEKPGLTPPAPPAKNLPPAEITAVTPPAPPPSPPSPPTPPPSPPPDGEPVRDLFGAFRNQAPYDKDYWQRLDEGLRHIKRLTGASVNDSTGTLILTGEYSAQEGPLNLSDLSAAFWGEFMGTYKERLGNKPGVTIDPASGPGWENKPMGVFYGGDTEDTRLGRRMFECDWLLKGLGLGIEAIAPAEKCRRISGYKTQFELAEKRGRSGAGEKWSRFWLALEDESKRGTKRGLLLQVNDANDTVWFPARFQLYACTEVIVEQPNGKTVSSGGVQDPSAREFVQHFNSHFEEYAAEFPQLNDLREAAKLTVTAHWMRERRPAAGNGKIVLRQAALDHELLYLTFPKPDPAGPSEVPVQKVEGDSWSIHGGVSMQCPPISRAVENSAAGVTCVCGMQGVR